MSAEIEASHLVFMPTGSITGVFFLLLLLLQPRRDLDTTLEIVLLRTHTEAN